MATTGLFDPLDDDDDRQNQHRRRKSWRCEEIGFGCRSVHHRRCSAVPWQRRVEEQHAAGGDLQ